MPPSIPQFEYVHCPKIRPCPQFFDGVLWTADAARDFILWPYTKVRIHSVRKARVGMA